MTPKNRRAYLIRPILCLISQFICTTWGFLAIFGLGVLAIIVFSVKNSSQYIKPKRFDFPGAKIVTEKKQLI